MRKLTFVALLLLCAIPVVSAEISVRVRGGHTFISPADYNNGAEGRNAYVASIAAHPPEGELGSLGPGWNIFGEAVFAIDRNFSIGLESGFLRISTGSQVAFQYPTTSPALLFGGTTEVSASVRAAPLILKAHYTRPIAGAVAFIAGLGGGVYFCSFDYRYDFIGGYMGATDWNEIQTFASTKSAFGLEGEIGLEIPLSKKIFAEINLGGRLARLSSLEGNWSDVGISDMGPYDSGGDDGFFSVYDYTTGAGKTYRFAAFDNNLRTGQPHFRKGAIDLSGFIITCGIRFVI